MLRLFICLFAALFLCSCAHSGYKPYVPVGASLDGGSSRFHHWASYSLQ